MVILKNVVFVGQSNGVFSVHKVHFIGRGGTLQCPRKTGPLIVLRHIRQNAVIIVLEILVAAELLGHRAAVSADRIGLVIQFRRRAAEPESYLPDNQLRRRITSVGVGGRFQIGAVRITVGQS